ncbi:MAG: EamA family transporter [Clostridia bacterium]|nr:EamA family transporter [Clostridia bacterium]
MPFLVELIFSISYFSVYEILSAVFRLIAVCCPFLFAKAKGKGLLYCIILFIISGAAVLLVKFYNMSADVVSDNSFCFWSNVVILPATVIMLLCRNKPKAIISDVKRIKARAYLLLIGFTLLNNFCTLLSIYAMNFMSATIFSVLQTSGVFILTSVFSVLMFKERFTKSEFFSLIFSIISVIFGIF